MLSTTGAAADAAADAAVEDNVRVDADAAVGADTDAEAEEGAAVQEAADAALQTSDHPQVSSICADAHSQILPPTFHFLQLSVACFQVRMVASPFISFAEYQEWHVLAGHM